MKPPLIHRPVALVGLPGAGKSRVGALLAAQLALPFLDSDAEIEGETGETIANLFITHGEAYFRAFEHQLIDRLLGTAPLVLATGGGAMAAAATRRILLARATIIWLDAPPPILAARLEGKEDRPLLAGNLEQRLATLQAERQAFYREAIHRIDAAPPPDVVLAAILAALNAENILRSG